MHIPKKTFKLGDSIRFKDGQKDEESGTDMSGWQGRINKIDGKQKLILVALDSLTLKNLPRQYLETCEEEGLGWSEYYIGFDDVELVTARDSPKDVQKTVAELSNSLGWIYLGEEGREINAILADTDGEYEQLGAWEDHLQKVLTFPFEAEISEWQRSGSALKVGQRFRVLAIDDTDENYGILVKVRKGLRSYLFPLCDLKVVPNNSSNHDPVQLYAVWFANK